MKELYQRFDQWMFGYGSPVTLGVFRAIFATLIVLGLLIQAGDIVTWFGVNGLSPASAALRADRGGLTFNPLAQIQNDSLVFFLYWVIVVFGILTALGVWTKGSSIILAIGIVAIHHRSPFILNAGDTLARVIAIYMALAPVGAAFSVDAWLKKKNNQPLVTEVSLWPQRLVQLQLAIVYLTTVLIKLQGPAWRNGFASWYPTQLIEFKKFSVPGFVDSLPVIIFTTYATLVIELALATLIFWKPARKWVVLSGIALHLGIEYRMNIPLFAFVMIACYLCHYSGDEVQAFLDRISVRFRPKVSHA